MQTTISSLLLHLAKLRDLGAMVVLEKLLPSLVHHEELIHYNESSFLAMVHFLE